MTDTPDLHPVALALKRLSDCLLAGHRVTLFDENTGAINPGALTGIQGTAPEMLDAAVEEITTLRACLEEANAHHAWAEEDGKIYKRVARILTGKIGPCEQVMCPEKTCADCHYDAEMEQARKEKR